MTDEDAYWEQVKGTVKPIDKRKFSDKQPKNEEVKPSAAAPTPKVKVKKPFEVEDFLPASESAEVTYSTPYLQSGDHSQIDGNNAAKLAKGNYPIDETLDLHGMTKIMAWERLQSKVTHAYESGLRCLLVITGKGEGKEGAGVIKRELPHWLNEPDMRPKVLMYTQAQPKHGGSGAWYVLIRKKKD